MSHYGCRGCSVAHRGVFRAGDSDEFAGRDGAFGLRAERSGDNIVLSRAAPSRFQRALTPAHCRAVPATGLTTAVEPWELVEKLREEQAAGSTSSTRAISMKSITSISALAGLKASTMNAGVEPGGQAALCQSGRLTGATRTPIRVRCPRLRGSSQGSCSPWRSAPENGAHK